MKLFYLSNQIYGLKCVDYSPPNIELEVTSINESESYLSELVSELGLQVRIQSNCNVVFFGGIVWLIFPFSQSLLASFISSFWICHFFQLKTNAVCSHIRCIRYGFFTLDHALLLKHVTLENVLRNMNDLKKIIHVNDNLRKQSPNIRTQIKQV